MAALNALELFERALESPDGIRVRSAAPDKLRRKLFLHRRIAADRGDNRFSVLSFRVVGNDLIILKERTP